jgi:hypothetical protein
MQVLPPASVKSLFGMPVVRTATEPTVVPAAMENARGVMLLATERA